MMITTFCIAMVCSVSGAYVFVRWPDIKAKVAAWVKSFNNVG